MASLPIRTPAAPAYHSNNIDLPPLELNSQDNVLPFIPFLSQFSRVQKTSLASNAAEAPTIIHIQDIHRNLEAQTNIGLTLQSLIEKGVVDVVGLEAAFSEMDFGSIQSLFNRSTVKKAADVLRKKFLISGPIHTAYLTQEKIPFVGVDDHKHYHANVEAVRESAPLKSNKIDEISNAKRLLEEEKRKIFNKPLLQFDQWVQAYRNESLPLSSYLKNLQIEKNITVPFSIDLFLEALTFEETLDFTRVEKERSRLVSQLAQKASPDQMKRLLQLSSAFRLGRINHADFYQELKIMVQKAGVELDLYPAMSDYLQYIALSDAIDAMALFNDLREFEDQTYTQLVQNAEERSLVKRSKQLYLEGKLVEFSLTSDEWRQYKSKNVDLMAFENFYRHAEARDRTMVETLLTVMKKEDAKVAVLVAGGFHSHGISSLLKEQDVNIVTVAPKISKVDTQKGSSYLSVFSREKTPLDNLFKGEKLFLAEYPTTALGQFQFANLYVAEQFALAGAPLADAQRQYRDLTGGDELQSIKILEDGRVELTVSRDLVGSEESRTVVVQVAGVESPEFESVPTVALSGVALSMPWLVKFFGMGNYEKEGDNDVLVISKEGEWYIRNVVPFIESALVILAGALLRFGAVNVAVPVALNFGAILTLMFYIFAPVLIVHVVFSEFHRFTSIRKDPKDGKLKLLPTPKEDYKHVWGWSLFVNAVPLSIFFFITYLVAQNNPGNLMLVSISVGIIAFIMSSAFHSFATHVNLLLEKPALTMPGLFRFGRESRLLARQPNASVIKKGIRNGDLQEDTLRQFKEALGKKVVEVGDTLKDNRADMVQKTMKRDNTPVSKGDLYAQHEILRFLLDNFPNAYLQFEEEIEDNDLWLDVYDHNERNAKSPFRIVVDPIDGTESFVKLDTSDDDLTMPKDYWSVGNIAVYYHNAPILTIGYAPEYNDGTLNEAFLFDETSMVNGNPVHIGNQGDLKKIPAIFLGAKREGQVRRGWGSFDENYQDKLSNHVDLSKVESRTGSTWLSAGRVASSGNFDGEPQIFLFSGQKTVDIGAHYFIAKAGGVVVDRHGRDVFPLQESVMTNSDTLMTDPGGKTPSLIAGSKKAVQNLLKMYKKVRRHFPKTVKDWFAEMFLKLIRYWGRPPPELIRVSQQNIRAVPLTKEYWAMKRDQLRSLLKMNDDAEGDPYFDPELSYVAIDEKDNPVAITILNSVSDPAQKDRNHVYLAKEAGQDQLFSDYIRLWLRFWAFYEAREMGYWRAQIKFNGPIRSLSDHISVVNQKFKTAHHYISAIPDWIEVDDRKFKMVPFTEALWNENAFYLGRVFQQIPKPNFNSPLAIAMVDKKGVVVGFTNTPKIEDGTFDFGKELVSGPSVLGTPFYTTSLMRWLNYAFYVQAYFHNYEEIFFSRSKIKPIALLRQLYPARFTWRTYSREYVAEWMARFHSHLLRGRQMMSDVITGGVVSPQMSSLREAIENFTATIKRAIRKRQGLKPTASEATGRDWQDLIDMYLKYAFIIQEKVEGTRDWHYIQIMNNVIAALTSIPNLDDPRFHSHLRVAVDNLTDAARFIKTTRGQNPNAQNKWVQFYRTYLAGNESSVIMFMLTAFFRVLLSILFPFEISSYLIWSLSILLAYYITPHLLVFFHFSPKAIKGRQYFVAFELMRVFRRSFFTYMFYAGFLTGLPFVIFVSAEVGLSVIVLTSFLFALILMALAHHVNDWRAQGQMHPRQQMIVGLADSLFFRRKQFGQPILGTQELSLITGDTHASQLFTKVGKEAWEPKKIYIDFGYNPKGKNAGRTEVMKVLGYLEGNSWPYTIDGTTLEIEWRGDPSNLKNFKNILITLLRSAVNVRKDVEGGVYVDSDFHSQAVYLKLRGANYPVRQDLVGAGRLLQRIVSYLTQIKDEGNWEMVQKEDESLLMDQKGNKHALLKFIREQPSRVIDFAKLSSLTLNELLWVVTHLMVSPIQEQPHGMRRVQTYWDSKIKVEGGPLAFLRGLQKQIKAGGEVTVPDNFAEQLHPLTVIGKSMEEVAAHNQIDVNAASVPVEMALFKNNFYRRYIAGLESLIFTGVALAGPLFGGLVFLGLYGGPINVGLALVMIPLFFVGLYVNVPLFVRLHGKDDKSELRREAAKDLRIIFFVSLVLVYFVAHTVLAVVYLFLPHSTPLELLITIALIGATLATVVAHYANDWIAQDDPQLKGIANTINKFFKAITLDTVSLGKAELSMDQNSDSGNHRVSAQEIRSGLVQGESIFLSEFATPVSYLKRREDREPDLEPLRRSLDSLQIHVPSIFLDRAERIARVMEEKTNGWQIPMKSTMQGVYALFIGPFISLRQRLEVTAYELDEALKTLPILEGKHEQLADLVYSTEASADVSFLDEQDVEAVELVLMIISVHGRRKFDGDVKDFIKRIWPNRHRGLFQDAFVLVSDVRDELKKNSLALDLFEEMLATFDDGIVRPKRSSQLRIRIQDHRRGPDVRQIRQAIEKRAKENDVRLGRVLSSLWAAYIELDSRALRNQLLFDLGLLDESTAESNLVARMMGIPWDGRTHPIREIQLAIQEQAHWQTARDQLLLKANQVRVHPAVRSHLDRFVRVILVPTLSNDEKLEASILGFKPMTEEFIFRYIPTTTVVLAVVGEIFFPGLFAAPYLFLPSWAVLLIVGSVGFYIWSFPVFVLAHPLLNWIQGRTYSWGEIGQLFAIGFKLTNSLFIGKNLQHHEDFNRVHQLADDLVDAARVNANLSGTATNVAVASLSETAWAHHYQWIDAGHYDRATVEQQLRTMAARDGLEEAWSLESALAFATRLMTVPTQGNAHSQQTVDDVLANLQENDLNLISLEGMPHNEILELVAKLNQPAYADKKVQLLITADHPLVNEIDHPLMVINEGIFYSIPNSSVIDLRLVELEDHLTQNDANFLKQFNRVHLQRWHTVRVITDGISEDSVLRDALFTILNELSAVTTNFNRLDMIGIITRVVSQQA